MGNRYGARRDEFEWTLGNRRRLARYLGAELSYAETAMLLGTSRGSVAAQASKQRIEWCEANGRGWQLMHAHGGGYFVVATDDWNAMTQDDC